LEVAIHVLRTVLVVRRQRRIEGRTHGYKVRSVLRWIASEEVPLPEPLDQAVGDLRSESVRRMGMVKEGDELSQRKWDARTLGAHM
jgi:hypothetical protein